MKWLGDFVDFASAQLGEREREALWTRGVSDEQIKLYHLGCVNQRLPDLAYPKPFLDWCWEGRRLRNMFVLPLTNTLGQVKGLQFRSVDPERKGYSDYTPCGEEPVTFGLAQAMPHVWKMESIWLVEGVFDVFPIQRVYPNIIPALTNHLNEPVARLFRRLVTHVWLTFDMDDKGREAARRVLYEYKNDRFKIHDVRLPRPKSLDGSGRVKDPSELWESWGDDRFREYLRSVAEMENGNAQDIRNR